MNNKNMVPEIVFWFDQPPKVGKGCFNYISNVWENKVIYVYLHDFSSTRAITKWADDDFGKAVLMKIGEDPTNLTADIFRNYPDAIHIIDGFKSDMFRFLKPYVLSDKYKVISFSERPGVYGKWWKRVLKRIYIPLSERRIARQYQEHVQAYLPLGTTGVKTAIRYGWEETKLFPFMYDPVDLVTDHNVYPVGKPMRFLYVGRFSRYTKGTDTLIRALDLMKTSKDDYVFDFVGGYGDMRDEVLKWMESKKNVSFLGAWDSLKVGMNMKKYDVCVVPSKFDGWNLLVNESVRAHIGIIVTDQAVSDEVVSSGRMGIVVPANSPGKLAKVMDYAVSHPDEVMLWKNRSKEFSSRISSQVVGDYMLNIIHYSCCNNIERPVCPWL